MKQTAIKQDERGVALLLAIFALFMITSIAVAMMFLTDTETSINSNFRDEQSAYYAARAGLEEARDRLRTTATASVSTYLPTTKPGAVGGVIYMLNPTGSETVAPWTSTNSYYDDEICKEVNCSGGSVPPTSGWYTNNSNLAANSAYAATPTLAYKWMRITLKTDGSASGWSGGTQNYYYVDQKSANASNYVCWSGTHEVVSLTACAYPNNPVYELTSLAVTNSGARRILQYEVVQPVFGLSFPGALTLDGTGDVMSGATSNPYKIQGADHAGCGSSASAGSWPAIAVNDAADKTTVTNGIPNNRQSNYTGTDGTSPDVNVETMPAGLQTVSSLQAFVSSVNSAAGQYYTGSVTSLSNPGTATAPQIIEVNGDLTLSGNVTGYGVLLVTGTLTVSGNVGWNGIVAVIGKGIVLGNGGGSNQYNGAFIVAQTVNPSTGATLSSPGSPNFNWNGGGGNGIYYSTGCINQAIALIGYKMIASRELMY